MRSTPLVHFSLSPFAFLKSQPDHLIQHTSFVLAKASILLCLSIANYFTLHKCSQLFFLSSEQTVFCTISLKPSYLFHTVYVCWKFWSVFSLTHLHKAFCRGSSSDALMIQLDLKQLYSQQFNFCFPQNSILFFSFSLFFYCLFSSHSCICFCLSNSGLRDGRSLSQLS